MTETTRATEPPCSWSTSTTIFCPSGFHPRDDARRPRVERSTYAHAIRTTNEVMTALPAASHAKETLK